MVSTRHFDCRNTGSNPVAPVSKKLKYINSHSFKTRKEKLSNGKKPYHSHYQKH